MSPSKKTYEWAIKHNIKYCNSIKEFQQLNLSQGSFDYLFSVVNYNMMPQSVLKLPRFSAINYHDSILPRYAGVHATSWAIINEECNHGVSWRIMNMALGKVDKLQLVNYTKCSQQCRIKSHGIRR